MTVHYFDHAASAPRRPEVLEAMAPFLSGVVGNPSGTHQAARAARRALEDARDEVAAFVGVDPHGVIFTAGGTESCHLAIAGTVRRARRRGERCALAYSAVEHHAVSATADALAADYADVTVRVLPVDHLGVVDLGGLTDLMPSAVTLVSVMAANNETGALQPLSAIGDALRAVAPGALLHTDAIAAAPWLDLRTATAEADLVSICGHKLGGPVSAGALGFRNGAEVDAVVPGGGQERGRRGGTVDVAAAVGLATAVRLCDAERAAGVRRAAAHQQVLEHALGEVPGVVVTAASAPRLPGHVHVTVDGAASDELLFLLDVAGVCASAASSCASGAGTPSHVLAAMGVPKERAAGAVRFTMGPETSDEDVAALVDIFPGVVARCRHRA